MTHGLVMFVLSEVDRTYGRQVYTVFVLLGDLGGFNAAIVIIPAFLLASYSARMFNKSISQNVPVKK